MTSSSSSSHKRARQGDGNEDADMHELANAPALPTTAPSDLEFVRKFLQKDVEEFTNKYYSLATKKGSLK